MELDGLGDYLRRVTVLVTSASQAVGAGVVWAPGWVVTNAHVIHAPRVMVRFPDDRRADARVVASNREADLAVLRVPDHGLPAAAPNLHSRSTPRAPVTFIQKVLDNKEASA